jgi:ABC-type glycerol-3-phosphate transport system substrate-binding protein
MRALRVTVAALVAAGLLTGCGVAATKAATPPTQSTFTQTPKPSDTGTATIWLPAAAATWTAAITAANAQFHRLFPNVVVQVSYRAEQRQLTDFASAAYASNAPAVLGIDASDSHTEIISGAFTQLTTVMTTFNGWQSWSPRLVAACTRQTTLYCVPFTGDIVLAVPAGTLTGIWADAWIRAASSASVQRLIMGD